MIEAYRSVGCWQGALSRSYYAVAYGMQTPSQAQRRDQTMQCVRTQGQGSNETQDSRPMTTTAAMRRMTGSIMTADDSRGSRGCKEVGCWLCHGVGFAITPVADSHSGTELLRSVNEPLFARDDRDLQGSLSVQKIL